METKKQKINLIEIYPIIKEKIDNGGTVKLPITGKSMRPLLVWGRDTVEIVKCDKAKKGDIIFYLRDNGQFVLHRIIDTDENGYILCGDNQWVKEHGIQDRHIIAVVSLIERKGKVFAAENENHLHQGIGAAILRAETERGRALCSALTRRTIIWTSPRPYWAGPPACASVTAPSSCAMTR